MQKYYYIEKKGGDSRELHVQFDDYQDCVSCCEFFNAYAFAKKQTGRYVVNDTAQPSGLLATRSEMVTYADNAGNKTVTILHAYAQDVVRAWIHAQAASKLVGIECLKKYFTSISSSGGKPQNPKTKTTRTAPKYTRTTQQLYFKGAFRTVYMRDGNKYVRTLNKRTRKMRYVEIK